MNITDLPVLDGMTVKTDFEVRPPVVTIEYDGDISFDSVESLDLGGVVLQFRNKGSVSFDNLESLTGGGELHLMNNGYASFLSLEESEVKIKVGKKVKRAAFPLLEDISTIDVKSLKKISLPGDSEREKLYKKVMKAQSRKKRKKLAKALKNLPLETVKNLLKTLE